jgi:D-alanyl-lipoteichoic acid acyltransferase DltB (MBOAT superfamily)
MGPMSYYHEHAASLRKAERLNGDAIVEILFRISVGLTKIYVIAPFFSPFSLQAIQATHTLPLLPTLLAAMSYSVVIWADFSGFSAVAIGCGKLMGIRVPENFNSPYLAPNIREFWQRWHISFSRVLTSYLFIPISRSLSKPLKSHPKVVMVLGYVLTFTFCGFWHGPSLNFIYWGLYHALGLIVYDLFKSRALKKGALQSGAKTTGFLKLLNSAFSTLLTFIFVSVGWILFMIKF